MEFIKTSILKQEFTSKGVKETETETRSKDELALEARLASLPEFNRDPQFRSLSEQINDDLEPKLPIDKPSSETTDSKYPVAEVTEEEFEFYESLSAKEKGLLLQRKKEDEDMRKEFAKAKEAQFTANTKRNDYFSNSKKHPREETKVNELKLKKPKNPINLFSATETKYNALAFAKSHNSPSVTKLQHPENDILSKRLSPILQTTNNNTTIASKTNPSSGVENNCSSKKEILADLFGVYEDSESEG